MLTKSLFALSLSLPAIFGEDVAVVTRDIPTKCKEHLVSNMDFFSRTQIDLFIAGWTEEKLNNYYDEEELDDSETLTFLNCFNDYVEIHRDCINTHILEKGLKNFWQSEGFFLTYKLKRNFIAMHDDDYFDDESRAANLQSIWEQDDFTAEDVDFTQHEWELMMATGFEMDDITAVRDEVWKEFGFEVG